MLLLVVRVDYVLDGFREARNLQVFCRFHQGWEEVGGDGDLASGGEIEKSVSGLCAVRWKRHLKIPRTGRGACAVRAPTTCNPQNRAGFPPGHLWNTF